MTLLLSIDYIKKWFNFTNETRQKIHDLGIELVIQLSIHITQFSYNQTLCVYLTSDLDNKKSLQIMLTIINIPNGCLDAYEVKVNKDTFKYQAKVK